jgi:diguanylate cyclase (GGDEF)-like protein/PAS domain S-box-containing protein
MSNVPPPPAPAASFVAPPNEAARLNALHSSRILSEAPRDYLDEVAMIARLVTGVERAFVDIVKENTTLVLAHSCGFEGELAREESFCATTILTPDRVMIVEDATQDPRFKHLAVVVGEPHIRFYAGAPLLSPEGLPIGALCVTDSRPRKLSEEQIQGLATMSKALTSRLELMKAVDKLQAEQQKFKVFMDNGPMVSFIKDSEGRYVFANQRFMEVFRTSDPEVIGKRDSDLWPPEIAEPLIAHDRYVFEQNELTELTEAGPLDAKGHSTWWRSYKFVIPGEPKLLGGVALDVTSLHRIQEKFKYLAETDVLTGLPNRMALNDSLKKALDRRRKKGHIMALMFMDVDHFKQVNDGFGHAVGDQLLIGFAARVRGAIRQSDLLFRLAGDEFVVVLEHLNVPEEAETVAKKINEALAKPVIINDHPHQISISIGIAIVNKESKDPSGWISVADDALYKAKRGGRGRYAFAGS